jgi:hypothetical protein
MTEQLSPLPWRRTAASLSAADRAGSVGKTHVLQQLRSASGAASAAKNLEKDLLGLEALQPIEIPQNRQRNLWKGLEQNSLDLERLGKKLGGRRHRRPRTLAGDRPGHPRREGGGLSEVCRNMVHARKTHNRLATAGLRLVGPASLSTTSRLTPPLHRIPAAGRVGSSFALSPYRPTRLKRRRGR